MTFLSNRVTSCAETSLIVGVEYAVADSVQTRHWVRQSHLVEKWPNVLDEFHELTLLYIIHTVVVREELWLSGVLLQGSVKSKSDR